MKKITTLLFFTLLVLNCSVKAPEVKITGEKTALENQVVGTYQQIEEDTWMVASVRASGQQPKVTMSEEKKRVLEAVQNRKFNKDDIDQFKRDGVLGENNRGFLELRPSEKLETDPEYKKLVLQLLEVENRDREIIMNRVLEVNDEAAKAGKEEVYAIFARMNQESAENGTWIQLPDGSWVKKGQAK